MESRFLGKHDTPNDFIECSNTVLEHSIELVDFKFRIQFYFFPICTKKTHHIHDGY